MTALQQECWPVASQPTPRQATDSSEGTHTVGFRNWDQQELRRREELLHYVGSDLFGGGWEWKGALGLGRGTIGSSKPGFLSTCCCVLFWNLDQPHGALELLKHNCSKLRWAVVLRLFKYTLKAYYGKTKQWCQIIALIIFIWLHVEMIISGIYLLNKISKWISPVSFLLFFNVAPKNWRMKNMACIMFLLDNAALMDLT